MNISIPLQWIYATLYNDYIDQPKLTEQEIPISVYVSSPHRLVGLIRFEENSELFHLPIRKSRQKFKLFWKLDRSPLLYD